MTRSGKRELVEAIRPRYLQASKAEKTRILDECVASTGYHCKHAIRLLKQGVKASGKKKPGKSKIYQGDVVIALTKIWAICGQICSRRLHPFLPEMVDVLKHHGELKLTKKTRDLLLQMSRANLVNAGLSQADLQGADLRGTLLEGANLNHADLRGADLTGARFDEYTTWSVDLEPVEASAVGTV